MRIKGGIEMADKKIKSKFAKPVDVGGTEIKCKKCGFINHFGGEIYNKMVDDVLKCVKCGREL